MCREADTIVGQGPKMKKVFSQILLDMVKQSKTAPPA